MEGLRSNRVTHQRNQMNNIHKIVLFSAFTPKKLFRSSDLGAWYDQSDMTSIYQDAIGSAAAAVAQPIGFVSDMRHGMARGGELVMNGTFASGSTAWTAGSGTAISVVSGQLKAENAAGTDGAFFGQNLGAFSAGQTVEVFFDCIDDGTSKEARPYLGTTLGASDIAGPLGVAFGTSRKFLHTFTADVANCWLWFYATALAVPNYILIDNVTAKLITGNHGVQTTADNRPILASGGKIDYDGVNDSLVTTWASALGSDCGVAYAIPQGEAVILNAQTINTTYTMSTDNCGLVIRNRSWTATEELQLRRWLNRRAG